MGSMKIEANRDEYLAADAEGKAKLLAKCYGLMKHQMWVHKQSGKWIVSHAGIESIAAQEGIAVSYDVIRCDPDFVVFMATPARGEDVGQATFGEASKENTKMSYLVAMAEKRGFDRSALKMVLRSVGGHGADFYGEDEADDFKASAQVEESAPAPVVNSTLITHAAKMAGMTDPAAVRAYYAEAGDRNKSKPWYKQDLGNFSDVMSRLLEIQDATAIREHYNVSKPSLSDEMNAMFYSACEAHAMRLKGK